MSNENSSNGCTAHVRKILPAFNDLLEVANVPNELTYNYTDDVGRTPAFHSLFGGDNDLRNTDISISPFLIPSPTFGADTPFQSWLHSFPTGESPAAFLQLNYVPRKPFTPRFPFVGTPFAGRGSLTPSNYFATAKKSFETSSPLRSHGTIGCEKGSLPSCLFDDKEDEDEENVLTVNVLLEFQEASYDIFASTWDCLDVMLQVVERAEVRMHGESTAPFHVSSLTTRAAPAISDIQTAHTVLESTMIEIEGSTRQIMQKSIDIILPDVALRGAITPFEVNLVFQELSPTEDDWCISSSCYIALQRARKVLSPIRSTFSKLLVDHSGKRATNLCTFGVKRNNTLADKAASARPVRWEEDALLHAFPSEKEVNRDFELKRNIAFGISNDEHDVRNYADAENDDDRDATNCNAYGDETQSPGASPRPREEVKIEHMLSMGMRPKGPNGRLMTRLQRKTLLSIRKRFRTQSSRVWKHFLQNSDLYPLFTLGRDECAKEMGVCTTWLKVRMRERGIKIWPNRKLITTTSSLFHLKKLRLEAETKMGGGATGVSAEEARLEAQMEQLRDERMKIVQACCSPTFYAEFAKTAPRTVLDPDWDT
jgi:RWP-RK domain